MKNTTNKTIAATKAKTQFAELIELARTEPITITRNNRPVAIVISPDQYQLLSKNKQKRLIPVEEMLAKGSFKSGDPQLSEKVDDIAYGLD